MLQACMFRSTSPPGPCVKAVLGYHSPLKNGNLDPPPIDLLPDAHQQSPFPAKLERPMEGGNDHTEKQ
jgi:hypothetical protein